MANRTFTNSAPSFNFSCPHHFCGDSRALAYPDDYSIGRGQTTYSLNLSAKLGLATVCP